LSNWNIGNHIGTLLNWFAVLETLQCFFGAKRINGENHGESDLYVVAGFCFVSSTLRCFGRLLSGRFLLWKHLKGLKGHLEGSWTIASGPPQMLHKRLIVMTDLAAICSAMTA
jgi:hypothetical protein